MLGVLVAIFVVGLPAYQIGRVLGAYQFATLAFHFGLEMMMFSLGARIRQHGPNPANKMVGKRYIFVCNHTCMLEPFIVCSLDCQVMSLSQRIDKGLFSTLKLHLT